MAETAIATVQAIAMINHAGQWTVAAHIHRGAQEAAVKNNVKTNGKATVRLFHNAGTNLYRILAYDVATSTYVINSPVTAGLKVRRNSPTFVSWIEEASPGRAPRVFGLNFPSPPGSDTFFAALTRSQEAFLSGTASPPILNPGSSQQSVGSFSPASSNPPSGPGSTQTSNQSIPSNVASGAASPSSHSTGSIPHAVGAFPQTQNPLNSRPGFPSAPLPQSANATRNGQAQTPPSLSAAPSLNTPASESGGAVYGKFNATSPVRSGVLPSQMGSNIASPRPVSMAVSSTPSTLSDQRGPRVASAFFGGSSVADMLGDMQAPNAPPRTSSAPSFGPNVGVATPPSSGSSPSTPSMHQPQLAVPQLSSPVNAGGANSAPSFTSSQAMPSMGAGASLGRSPADEKERVKEDEEKWVALVRQADPNPAPVAVAPPSGMTDRDAYKAYMVKRYEREQWENGCLLKARRARKAHIESGKTWLIDGGVADFAPAPLDSGAFSSGATSSPTVFAGLSGATAHTPVFPGSNNATSISGIGSPGASSGPTFSTGSSGAAHTPVFPGLNNGTSVSGVDLPGALSGPTFPAGSSGAAHTPVFPGLNNGTALSDVGSPGASSGPTFPAGSLGTASHTPVFPGSHNATSILGVESPNSSAVPGQAGHPNTGSQQSNSGPILPSYNAGSAPPIVPRFPEPNSRPILPSFTAGAVPSEVLRSPEPNSGPILPSFNAGADPAIVPTPVAPRENTFAPPVFPRNPELSSPPFPQPKFPSNLPLGTAAAGAMVGELPPPPPVELPSTVDPLPPPPPQEDVASLPPPPAFPAISEPSNLPSHPGGDTHWSGMDMHDMANQIAELALPVSAVPRPHLEIPDEGEEL